VPHDVDASAIVGIRWVHVYEEDKTAGAVYRPDSGPVPLSRRPREALTLNADGSATVEAGGPDDRPTGRPARWSDTPAGIVVEAAAHGGQAPTVLTITQASADYLIVS
jgi:hypothetical protein